MVGQGKLRMDTWLSKLLWAIANKQGGTLRIGAMELEDAPDHCAVVTEYEKATHEFVIYAFSGNSSMIVINTEQQWTKQTSPTQEPLPPSPSSSPPQSRGREPLTDEEMASIERQMIKRAATREAQRRRAEEIEAMKAL